MLSFKNYLSEAWVNKVGKESKDPAVTSNDKYNSPSDFKKDAKKVGNIGPLEIHSSDNEKTHFTWSPQDRKIHHVIRASQTDKINGNTRLKYLGIAKRNKSPVSMGDVYKHLVKHHGVEFTGTGHSTGAQKMWNRFHDDPHLEVIGHHPDTGEEVKLNKDDKKYAPKNATSPEEKRVGRMNLILRKKQ